MTSNNICVKLRNLIAHLFAALAVLLATAVAWGGTVCYFTGGTRSDNTYTIGPYIDTGKKFALNDSLSMSAWVRVSPTITTVKPIGGIYYGAAIAGQGFYGSEKGFGFLTGGFDDGDASNDYLGYQIRVTSGSPAMVNDAYKTNTLFTADEWHHFLVVRDKAAGKARFYVDGELLSEKECPNWDLNPPSRNFVIAYNPSGAGGSFCGCIADIALWDVALSTADAARLPRVGVNGASTAPIAYFPLNEGSGNTVYETVNNTSHTASGGNLVWEDDPNFLRGTSADTLAVFSSPEDVGSPSPAYGVTNGLAAGASFVVSCGTTPAANAAGTTQYSCTGWKLYDEDDSLIDSGATTSFTYTHPNPAEYRKLEWQWAATSVKGTVAAGAGGSVSPSGEAWYAVDTPVTVTATPGAGKGFARWMGTLPDGIDANSASVTFAPSAPFAMTATFGDVFHVATTGDDVNGDGSQGNPFATIGAAITAADAAIAGGDTSATIHVADGEYTLAGVCTLTNSIVVEGNAVHPSAVVLTNAGHRAFFLDNASCAVKGMTITGTGTTCTDSNGGQGGHIWITSGLVEDCIVQGGGIRNVTGFNGGNIRLGNGTLRRCKILNGTTGWGGCNGGNVFAVGGVIESCLIAGGHIGGGGTGAGVWTYDKGVTKIINCTFIGQSGNKPAVLIQNSGSRVVNCVFYDNGGTATLEWGNQNGGCFVNCATVSGAAITGGTGNISTLTAADFKDYSNGDYTPAKDGALVNAGTRWTDYLSYGATSESDLAGAARLSGKILDIGCYEIAFGVGFTLIVR